MRSVAIIAALFMLAGLAACGVTGKDISVAEYSSHMRIPFDKLEAKHKLGKAGKIVVIGDSKEKERRWVADAVSTLNKDLPSCIQLAVAAPDPDMTLTDRVTAGKGSSRRFPNYPTEERDKLYIEYVTDREFYTLQGKIHEKLREKVNKGRQAASAWVRYIQVLRGTHVYENSGRNMEKLLIHEILHSLGLKGHVPDNVRSVLSGGSMAYRWHHDGVLSKSDKAALAHLYPCK